MSSPLSNYERYLRAGSVTSFEDFKLLIDRRKNGTPLGRAWGIYPDLECAACNGHWDAIHIIGTKGKKCPYCGFYFPNFRFAADDPCDGGWLSPVGETFAKINFD